MRVPQKTQKKKIVAKDSIFSLVSLNIQLIITTSITKVSKHELKIQKTSIDIAFQRTRRIC